MWCQSHETVLSDTLLFILTSEVYLIRHKDINLAFDAYLFTAFSFLSFFVQYIGYSIYFFFH